MSIVLVDAPKPLEEAERAVLARLGLPVVSASPATAADAVRQVRARAVLVAEGSGDVAALCQAVRATGVRAPILLLTDDDGPEAQARARAAGADAPLARPLTRPRLGRRLRAFLGGGRGGVESRDNARVPVRVPVLFGPAAPDLAGYLYNLSRTGLFVMSDRTFPPGTLLQLRLQLPNSQREFAGTGRVVWVSLSEAGAAPGRPPGMGIEFADLPPDTRGLIELLVARLCREGHAAG